MVMTYPTTRRRHHKRITVAESVRRRTKIVFYKLCPCGILPKGHKQVVCQTTPGSYTLTARSNLEFDSLIPRNLLTQQISHTVNSWFPKGHE